MLIHIISCGIDQFFFRQYILSSQQLFDNAHSVDSFLQSQVIIQQPLHMVVLGGQKAKQRGAYRGRKRSLSDADILSLRQRIQNGDKKAKVAREFGISRETLYQYLRAV